VNAARGAVSVDSIPRRCQAPSLEWVEVEAEVVAWSAGREELHRLDRIASLVFLLCDGSTPLRETVRELAETFGQPEESVRPDVLALVEAFSRDGLVLLD